MPNKSARSSRKARQKKSEPPNSQSDKQVSGKEATSQLPKDENTDAASTRLGSLPATPDTDERTPATSFSIVGIGASAGGLEAFTAFLKALPPDTGMAFVLVQHMDPKHESMLHRLLAKDTAMPVAQVEDGMPVEQNHVYVIPPDAEMTIHGGVLKLVARSGGVGRHTPIDTFLTSLAEDQGPQAIGVILSGIGSDGTKGLEAIKAEGGITLAQDEESSRYPGMPLYAFSAGCVDLVLPPDKLAREIAQMTRHPYLHIAQQAAEPAHAAVEDGNLRRIFRSLQTATGVDFGNYKPTTIRRRISRRMLVRRCETLAQYAQYLNEHPDEIQALFQDVLIHVTSFFRDPEYYQYLKASVFPRICASLDSGDAVRIWVPGCSSGEEVYSIAIVLHEFLGEAANQTRIQIFATDISDSDIQKARAAIYPESALSDVSPEQLRRFFGKVEGGYQISKALRDLCVFARHDVTRDPPFSRMDLISCRNVLIYLNSVLQKKVLSYFHYALKPNGRLALGRSETVSAAAELYSVEDRKANIYAKVASPGRVLTEFRDFEPDKAAAAAPKVFPATFNFDLRKEVERVILDRYAPPGFVVNGSLQIVHFQGDTSPLIKPAAGEASFSLVKLVAPPLMLEVRSAIQEAKKSGALVRREGVRFKRNGHTCTADLEVVPIDGRKPKSSDFLVLFQNLQMEVSEKRLAATLLRSKKAETEKEIERLKRELASTQNNLRDLVEDQEAAAEELRAANEEILSSNEELQSTNEELETAKEELQSSNEELTTLNEELQNRNVELTQTASDLRGLLGGVDIAVVILGKDLCLRRFSPAAEKLFNLIPSDIGRPIGQLRPTLDVPDLAQLASKVIETGRPLELEARDQQGRWYALRIRPYETVKDQIEGVLVAVIGMGDKQQFSAAIVETLPEAILVLDAEFHVLSANAAYFQRFHTTIAETEHRVLFELGGHWNIPGLKGGLEKVLPQQKPLTDLEMKQDFRTDGHKTILLSAYPLSYEGTGGNKILLVIRDQ